MIVNPFTDVVEGNGYSDPFVDDLLWPVRALADGRSYEVICDSNGDLSQCWVQDHPKKANAVWQKILAVIVILTVVPVIIGLVLRAMSLDDEQLKTNTVFIESMIKKQRNTPVKGELFKPPPDEELLSKEINRLRNQLVTTPQELLTGYELLCDDLKTSSWLKTEVLGGIQRVIDWNPPRGQGTVRAERRAFAQQETFVNLAFILNRLNLAPHLTNEAKIKILQDWTATAKKCDTAWNEGSHRLVKKVLDIEDTPKTLLLSYIGAFKEEIFTKVGQSREFIQLGSVELHGINYAKFFLADEFGVAKNSLENDGYFMAAEQTFSIDEMRDQILQNFTLDQIVTSVATSISLDPHHQEMFTDQLEHYFQETEGMSSTDAKIKVGKYLSHILTVNFKDWVEAKVAKWKEGKEVPRASSVEVANVHLDNLALKAIASELYDEGLLVLKKDEHHSDEDKALKLLQKMQDNQPISFSDEDYDYNLDLKPKIRTEMNHEGVHFLLEINDFIV